MKSKKLVWAFVFLVCGLAGGVSERLGERLYSGFRNKTALEGYNKAIGDLLAGLKKDGRVTVVMDHGGEKRQLVLVPQNTETKISKEEK